MSPFFGGSWGEGLRLQVRGTAGIESTWEDTIMPEYASVQPAAAMLLGREPIMVHVARRKFRDGPEG